MITERFTKLNLPEYDPITEIINDKIVTSKLLVKFNYCVRKYSINRQTTDFQRICYQKNCAHIRAILKFEVSELTKKLTPEIRDFPSKKWRLKIRERPTEKTVEGIISCFYLENFYIDFENGKKLWK